MKDTQMYDTVEDTEKKRYKDRMQQLEKQRMQSRRYRI